MQDTSALLFSNRQFSQAAEGGWMSLPADTPTTRSVERFRNRTLTFFPGEMMSVLYRRHGSITVIGPFVFLLGPEANRFILANAELFNWRAAFRAFIPVGGEAALIVSDGAAHRRMRRLVQPFFHLRQVSAIWRSLRRTPTVSSTSGARGSESTWTRHSAPRYGAAPFTRCLVRKWPEIRRLLQSTFRTRWTSSEAAWRSSWR